ncbi:uncharacterized protein F5Z01DRAFT_665312 [Emericellopsis atlantica]|uniref:Uncharacterized protein n=1 Tax=Emericellopsis atlantica TaxID=2614577 RepID=A0A9P7ZET9_9HYPO|nr:uncharacterized protein F5Z01DRAFT_665312 [Emericellopsis atlantica]KAG9250779.1 hypothetical protein F5Z01DRAFT_665312 [Emericellopsis atlantica]
MKFSLPLAMMFAAVAIARPVEQPGVIKRVSNKFSGDLVNPGLVGFSYFLNLINLITGGHTDVTGDYRNLMKSVVSPD